MNKSTGILLALTSLFLGIIIGLIFSQAKNGIQIGNNSGNMYANKKSEDEIDYDDKDNMQF